MKSAILTFAVLVLCLGVTRAANRKCYACVTKAIDSKNMLTDAAPTNDNEADCAGKTFKDLADKSKYEVECASETHQCGVWEKEKPGEEGDTDIYHRGCVTADRCKTLKDKKTDGDYRLETECCSQDLCNDHKLEGDSNKPKRKCYACVTAAVDGKNYLTDAAPKNTEAKCAGRLFKDLTDADKKKLEVECPSADHQCGVWEKEKEGEEGKTDIYHRGCVTADRCKTLEGKTEDGDWRLETECCTSDFCNTQTLAGDSNKDGAQAMMTSYLLLVVCLLLAKL